MDPVYLPVHQSEKCETGWRITTKRRGKGYFSDTFASCCDNNCEYVAKVQGDSISSRRESEIQRIASTIGVAVPITDIWNYRDNLVIVMPTLKYTFAEIFNQLRQKCTDDEKTCQDVANTVADYVNRTIEKIDLLRKNNIIHNDMNLGNIMVDDNDEIFLIDYGISQIISSEKIFKKFYYEKDIKELIDITSREFNNTPVWKYLKQQLPQKYVVDFVLPPI